VAPNPQLARKNSYENTTYSLVSNIPKLVQIQIKSLLASWACWGCYTTPQA